MHPQSPGLRPETCFSRTFVRSWWNLWALKLDFFHLPLKCNLILTEGLSMHLCFKEQVLVLISMLPSSQSYWCRSCLSAQLLTCLLLLNHLKAASFFSSLSVTVWSSFVYSLPHHLKPFLIYAYSCTFWWTFSERTKQLLCSRRWFFWGVSVFIWVITPV